MAARLGLKPWEAARLQPSEIQELYKGLLWRHSREVEIVAAQTRIIMTSILGDSAASLRDFCRMFPGYDDGH